MTLLPTLPSAPILTILILTLAIITHLYKNYLKLRHIPGPFLNAISPLPITYHTLKKDMNVYLYGLHKRYGPLVRVNPTTVLVCDAETLRYVFSTKGGFRKSEWFEFTKWDPERYSSLSMRDDEARKVRKGLLAPAFMGQGFALMERRVDRQIQAFVDLIERKYVTEPGETPKPMEMGHRTQYLVLDMITDVTFGEPFGFLAGDEDVHRFVEINEGLLPIMGILGTMPWLVRLLHSWPLKGAMPGDGDNVGFGTLMKFAGEAVKKRLEPGFAESQPDAENDVILTFLNNGISFEDTVQECITLVVAGTETTVVAIRHLILALLTTPRVYRKLQAEIDAYYSNSSSQTNPSPNPNSKDTKTKTKTIPYADTKSLPYLQASIRESLRLWPPSASMLSKEVPPPSKSPSPTSSTLNQIEYKLHGYTLPPGTAIGQHLYAVGRHRGTWGGDAEVFRPERWFEASLEEETKEGKEGVGGVGGGVDGGWEKRKLKEMQAANDIVFSSGKYLCLGKSIALMEIGKFFCEVMRRYDMAIHDPLKPAKIADPIVWVINDFYVQFTRRE